MVVFVFVTSSVNTTTSRAFCKKSHTQLCLRISCKAANWWHYILTVIVQCGSGAGCGGGAEQRTMVVYESGDEHLAALSRVFDSTERIHKSGNIKVSSRHARGPWRRAETHTDTWPTPQQEAAISSTLFLLRQCFLNKQ